MNSLHTAFRYGLWVAYDHVPFADMVGGHEACENVGVVRDERFDIRTRHPAEDEGRPIEGVRVGTGQ